MFLVVFTNFLLKITLSIYSFPSSLIQKNTSVNSWERSIRHKTLIIYLTVRLGIFLIFESIFESFSINFSINFNCFTKNWLALVIPLPITAIASLIYAIIVIISLLRRLFFFFGLWTPSFAGDCDGGQSKNLNDEEEVQVPRGPITRSRAKAFKEKLNVFIQDILKSPKYIKEEGQKVSWAFKYLKMKKSRVLKKAEPHPIVRFHHAALWSPN